MFLPEPREQGGPGVGEQLAVSSTSRGVGIILYVLEMRALNLKRFINMICPRSPGFRGAVSPGFRCCV